MTLIRAAIHLSYHLVCFEFYEFSQICHIVLHFPQDQSKLIHVAFTF